MALTRQETRALYDSLSRWYDGLTAPSERRCLHAGLSLLSVCAGETVLDLGCGTGHGVLVLGADLSEKMLARAKQRVEQAGFSSRVRWLLEDATRLPLAPSSVDAVFMSFTLELFDDSEISRVLEECRRVWCPMGPICVVSLSRTEPLGISVKAYEWVREKMPRWCDCRPIWVEDSMGCLPRHRVCESR